MKPVLASIKALTLQIREYNRKIIELGKTSYPEVSLLTQVHGAGPLVVLTYILTLEDPHGFVKSRDADCYIGLQPARRNSGTCQPQLHITKEGDPYLSTLMRVRHFATDSSLNGTYVTGPSIKILVRWIDQRQDISAGHGDFAEIVIPKVWMREDRKISRIGRIVDLPEEGTKDSSQYPTIALIVVLRTRSLLL